MVFLEDAMSDQPGFFDLDNRYAALSAAGDPLLRLDELVDFEQFRRPLLRALRRSERRKGGRQLADLIDPENTASPLWADTAYRSKRNEKMLARQGKRSQIHFRKPRGKPMPATLAKANAARSAVRSAVEHVFAHQKGLMALSVRTIGIARAEAKIGMANLAYNMRRFLWLEGRATRA